MVIAVYLWVFVDKDDFYLSKISILGCFNLLVYNSAI